MKHNSQKNKSLNFILLAAGVTLLVVTALILLSNIASITSGSSYSDDETIQLNSANTAPISTTRSGEEVYARACAACHTSGLIGSPMPGDKDSWAPRLALVGFDGLITSVIMGKGAMPARGGNPSITDKEVQAAVTYMLQGTGLELK